MEMQRVGEIIAVITTRPDLVMGGGAPVFLAQDEAERDAMALTLARTTHAMVHALPNGVLFLVRH